MVQEFKIGTVIKFLFKKKLKLGTQIVEYLKQKYFTTIPASVFSTIVLFRIFQTAVAYIPIYKYIFFHFIQGQKLFKSGLRTFWFDFVQHIMFKSTYYKLQITKGLEF